MTASLSAAEPAPELKIGSLPVSKILVLGNSITFHPPSQGWTGNWGMAASAKEKDFAHRLLAHIEKAAHGKPELRAYNIADFERQHASWDFTAALKDTASGEPIADDYAPDLIILAIGENVPALETPEARDGYEKAFASLLKRLDHSGHPTFIVRSCFWGNPAKDDIMRKVCGEAGGHFVDLKGLDADPLNYARAERDFEHPGVAGHPGDRGMAAIADAIWSVIQKIPAAAQNPAP